MYRPDIVAIRLRKAREAWGYNRSELARRVPCGPSIIGAVELQNRKLSVDMAVAIARVLDVKPAWLLDLEE